MIAGLKYGMQVVGFETNVEYFELAKIRIEHFLVNQKSTLFQ
jgi:hypothetical protein